MVIRCLGTAVLVCLGFTLCLLCGCSSLGNTSKLADGRLVSEVPASEKTRYECGYDFEFDALIEGDVAWLFFPEQTVALPRVPTVSGTRYHRGAVSFWLDKDKVVLEQGQESRSSCFTVEVGSGNK